MQNSGPWDPWLLVLENSPLFAQRAQRTVRPLNLDHTAPVTKCRNPIVLIQMPGVK